MRARIMTQDHVKSLPAEGMPEAWVKLGRFA